MAKLSLRSNKKFLRLCRDLKRPPYQVRGLLEMMWESAYENDVAFDSLDDMEIVSTWDGDEGAFGKALLAAGLVDEVDGFFVVHDYREHAPYWWKERERKRKVREVSGNVQDNSGTTADAGASREEKSRVEKSRVEKSKEEIKIPPVGGDTCPLRSLPKITSLYEGIRAILLEVHPHAKLSDIGTTKELDDRKELERIVRLDGYDEQAVIDTLGYVLQDEPHSDKFMWRDQFRSFAGLRKVSDGATKFSRMHDAMRKFKDTPAKPAIPSCLPQKPPYPGMIFQDGAWIYP
jgi:hypothetical protein